MFPALPSVQPHAGHTQLWPVLLLGRPDNRPECADRKQHVCEILYLPTAETGEWGTEAGRGKGKKGMQGAGVRK